MWEEKAKEIIASRFDGDVVFPGEAFSKEGVVYGRLGQVIVGRNTGERCDKFAVWLTGCGSVDSVYVIPENEDFKSSGVLRGRSAKCEKTTKKASRLLDIAKKVGRRCE